jgi:hypothetical protein
MTTPDQRVQELMSIYTDPKACLADLLCDRHPAEAIAFTIVEPDLSAHDLSALPPPSPTWACSRASGWRPSWASPPTWSWP